MAGTFVPPPSRGRQRFTDLHLKLKSRVPVSLGFIRGTPLRPILIIDAYLFLFPPSSLFPIPALSSHPFFLPSILAVRSSCVNMQYGLSGARPGRISKQKSCRPVHSSARPDVFTLRRTVYSEGMGGKLRSLRGFRG